MKNFTQRKREKMKTYKVTKYSVDGQEKNYGIGYTEEDVKAITKGYAFDGLFYNRQGSKWFFIVEED